MRAVLMAAGVGSRISREISKPKSLLDVGGGKTLIRHTVELLRSHGIDVTIVVGYKKELFFEELEGLSVEFVINPFYRVSNSVASLWFARESLKEDTDYLFGNADVFFEEDILKLLLDCPEETVLLSDTRRAKEGDYLFGLENGYIRKYGKELPMEDRDCEYVGLGKVKRSYMKRFVEIMEEMVDTENYQTWWEMILYDHCMEQPVKSLDVAPYFWSEIDYIEDYMRIVNYVRENNEQCTDAAN